MKKYSSLIIGAGLIASGFDEPQSEAILTHAHAYKNNPDIDFLGFYDIDYEKAQAAAQKWGVEAFKELSYADIISICTPDEFHAENVLKAEKLNPKLIFLEKPICRNKKDIEILRNVKTPILVDYSRNFSKDIQNLAKRIKSGEFGKFKTGIIYYGKGSIHNGSHMINISNLLIGKIKSIDFIKEECDCYENDTTKTGIVTFENGAQLYLSGTNCNDYTIMEFEYMFEKARVRMLNSGYVLEIHKVKDNEKFKGYRNLVLDEVINTDLDFTMANAVQNAIDYLNGKADLLCTLDDGREAIKFG